MSFLSTAFSGASNNFTPSGSSYNNARIQDANANYGNANIGLNSLAQTLQDQIAGKGPSVAQTMLNQSTGQNVGNQAALQAGQRGAASNVGLMSRQIGQQGANLQQQATGQGAIQRAMEQLQATGQLGQVYGTQGSLANQNYGIAQGALNANNATGAKTAGENAQMNQGLIGGASNALMGLLADGGEAGSAPKQSYNVMPGLGSRSNFGFNFVSGKSPKSDPMVGAADITPTNDNQMGFPMMSVGSNPVAVAAQGGFSQSLPFAPPQSMKSMGAMTMAPGGIVDAKRGGTVPGEPKHNYNTIKNDVVPAMLTPKEIVLPIEVTQSPDAPQRAAKFVADELAKHGHGAAKNDFKGAIKRGMEARKKK